MNIETIISAIDEKFGGSAEIILYMDFSGYVKVYNFHIKEFEYVFKFDDIREVTIEQINSIEIS